jgi:hypothetical protein
MLLSPELGAFIETSAPVRNVSRFILCGSANRALLLGAQGLPSQGDFDFFDRKAELRSKHSFVPEGLILDFQPNREIRPIAEYSSTWGIYEHRSRHPNREEPLVTFDESIITTAQFAIDGLKITGLDACGHLGLFSICEIAIGTFVKHPRQMQQLRTYHAEVCGQKEHALDALVPELSARMTERLRRYPPSPYIRARSQFFHRAPRLAARAQRLIGPAIQNIRGSQQQITPISIDQLLAHDYANG